MNVAAVIAALGLPSEARIDQRVPKKLLAEQGAPTAADRRWMQDGIEELVWIAALKPTNIGVPAFRDDAREYLEIAVLSLSLRTAKAARIVELIHRAIPYPVLLVTAPGETVSISLAHKRFSAGEGGKVVLEELHKTTPLVSGAPLPEESDFLASLALSSLPACDLFALYQGWIDRVTALEAARVTGTFAPPGTPERATALNDGLEEYARLTREIAVLRAQAKREKQLNRRVELNLEINRLKAELTAVELRLRSEETR